MTRTVESIVYKKIFGKFSQNFTFMFVSSKQKYQWYTKKKESKIIRVNIWCRLRVAYRYKSAFLDSNVMRWKFHFQQYDECKKIEKSIFRPFSILLWVLSRPPELCWWCSSQICMDFRYLSMYNMWNQICVDFLNRTPKNSQRQSIKYSFNKRFLFTT